MKLPKLAVFLAATTLTPLISSPAAAYDMDCAVILCMSGGFPGADCQPPFNYMIARITRFPAPLPPFGPCTFEGASGAISTLPLDGPEYEWLSKIRIMWWGSSKRHKTGEGDLYSWSFRSCTADNECKHKTNVWDAGSPPPKRITTENGSNLALPGYGRFVDMEYSTYDGRITTTGWVPY